MKLLNDNTEKKKKETCVMTKDQMIEKMREINEECNDNPEERKNALKILMGGIPVGNKVFVIVPVEDLHIDDSYQRPVHYHVKTIAQEWVDM